MEEETKNTQEKETVATVDNEEEVETYTREQFEEKFNIGVKERLAKKDKNLLEKYGVSSYEELDNKIAKAESYDVVNEDFKKVTETNKSLTQKLSFKENNIDPDRIDDVKTYFKGKEIKFSNDELVKALETHKEWIKQPKSLEKEATVVIGGQDKKEKAPLTRDERLKRAWGL